MPTFIYRHNGSRIGEGTYTQAVVWLSSLLDTPSDEEVQAIEEALFQGHAAVTIGTLDVHSATLTD